MLLTPFLAIQVDTFYAVGSPLGVFLSLRNVRIGIGMLTLTIVLLICSFFWTSNQPFVMSALVYIYTNSDTIL
jgi:hypothetical protein